MKPKNNGGNKGNIVWIGGSDGFERGSCELQPSAATRATVESIDDAASYRE